MSKMTINALRWIDSVLAKRVLPVAAMAVVIAATPFIAYGLTSANAEASAGPDPVAAQYARCQADLAARPAPTGSYLTWLNNCVRAFAPATASPTPTVSSPGPTSTPTVSPSPSASPSNSPTSSPTPSPTPSATSTSPTPTPTGPQVNCMDNPSRCGYPDYSNTGVPPGTVLAATGGLTLSTPGVYSGLSIHGCVTVTAANVTLTRSFISSCTGSYAVRVDSASANFTLSDSEILMQGDQKGLVFVGYTAQRVRVTGVGDCFGTGTNSTIIDSYCENGPGNSPKRAPNYGPEPVWCEATGAHWDGVEAGATIKTIIRHNTFRLPCGQTGTVNVSDWNGPVSGVVIDNNLLAGGSWTVYCGSPTTGVSLTNNRFSRWYWPAGGSANTNEATQGYCWSASRSGNVWDDTNQIDQP